MFYSRACHIVHCRGRHPHVSQLFGISSTPGIHALIYYDGKLSRRWDLGIRTIHGTELVPLRLYRKIHRPSSDLVWSCIEAMLVRLRFASRCKNLTSVPFKVQAVQGRHSPTSTLNLTVTFRSALTITIGLLATIRRRYVFCVFNPLERS